VQFFLKKRKYLLSLRASFSTFAFFCILHSEEIQRVEIFRHSYQQDTASGSQPLSRSMTWLPASQPASGKKEVIFIAGAVATLLTHPGPAGAASACPHRRRCAAAAARPSVRRRSSRQIRRRRAKLRPEDSDEFTIDDDGGGGVRFIRRTADEVGDRASSPPPGRASLRRPRTDIHGRIQGEPLRRASGSRN